MLSKDLIYSRRITSEQPILTDEFDDVARNRILHLFKMLREHDWGYCRDIFAQYADWTGQYLGPYHRAAVVTYNPDYFIVQLLSDLDAWLNDQNTTTEAIRDLLDTAMIWLEEKKPQMGSTTDFINGVGRLFEEEHLSYQVVQIDSYWLVMPDSSGVTVSHDWVPALGILSEEGMEEARKQFIAALKAFKSANYPLAIGEAHNALDTYIQVVTKTPGAKGKAAILKAKMMKLIKDEYLPLYNSIVDVRDAQGIAHGGNGGEPEADLAMTLVSSAIKQMNYVLQSQKAAV